MLDVGKVSRIHNRDNQISRAAIPWISPSVYGGNDTLRLFFPKLLNQAWTELEDSHFRRTLLASRHIPVQKWRAHLNSAATVLRQKKCSGNPQYKFRSQAQTIFSYDYTGYYLDSKFSAGTATSEPVGAGVDINTTNIFLSAALFPKDNHGDLKSTHPISDFGTLLQFEWCGLIRTRRLSLEFGAVTLERVEASSDRVMDVEKTGMTTWCVIWYVCIQAGRRWGWRCF